MTESIKKWLESIMPTVVGAIVEYLTEETLFAFGVEEGIHGPITINLEEFHAPITAINYYVIVVGDGMMLATAAVFEGQEEGCGPDIEFDMFFPISEFATSFFEEESIQQMIDRVIRQYEKKTSLG